jgi:ribokinase
MRHGDMSMSDVAVLVVGSLHLDIVVSAPALPAIDETVRGSSWTMVCGGKGGNQACWAARCGASTAMISRIGRDDFGTRLLANLKAAHVDTSGISIDPEAGSGMSVAIVQDDGDYGAVIVSGSNLKMIAAEVMASLSANGIPRVVVLQNEVEEPINVVAARHASSLGALVILNAAPARPLSAELAALVDVLVVNRVEAAMMSGQPVSSIKEAQAALPMLQTLCKSVIVTMGGLGLIVAEDGKDAMVIEAEKIAPVSTHGAGDCFIGQLAAALATGVPLPEASRLASRTAAAYVAGQLQDGAGGV